MSTDRSDTTRGGGAPPPSPPGRVPFREAAAWGLGVAITLAAAFVAGAGAVVLTVFGLGGIVLAVIAVVAVLGATVWRSAMRPLAVVALAMALPAAWAANTDERIGRSSDWLFIEPHTPADVRPGVYRRGRGDVLVDLRRFSAPAGSTTPIAARSDTGQLVVALPQDHCFNLSVRFTTDRRGFARRFTLAAVRAVTATDEPEMVWYGSMGLTMPAIKAENEASTQATLRAFDANSDTWPTSLLAFGRTASNAGSYQRLAAGEPEAPTLRLDLRASQQIVLRDYPIEVDPLDVGYANGFDPVGGTVWPEGTPKPTGPDRVPTGYSAVRTPENRAKWIAWEGRMVAWAKAQAKRAAGPCASRDDLRDRGFMFLTQPESVRANGRTDRLLGTGSHRRSALPQRVVTDPDTMLLIEVDGLGGTRLVNVRPHAGDRDSSVPR